MQPENRRWLGCAGASVTQFVWAGVFCAGAVLSVVLLRLFHLGLPLRIGVLLLAILPGVLYILTMIRDIRRLDELQQRIYLEAISVAFAGTFLFAILYPTLRQAGVVPAMSPTELSAVMVALATVSYLVAKRRY